MAQCNRCGRTLKNSDYIEIGYGKVCAEKMGITAHAKKKRTSRSVIQKHQKQQKKGGDCDEVL